MSSMLQPYQGSRGGDDARKPIEAAGPSAAQRCESLRLKIREQRSRLATLPPDTHEAEYCRRHIRFFEAELDRIEQATDDVMT
jgi:hypothetical protein